MRFLLLLYPRAWRDRYGEELQQLIESDPRTWRLVLDLLAGAVDAHMNPQWMPASAPAQEPKTMSSLLVSCGSGPYSSRANRQSAALMIGSSLALVLVHSALIGQYGKAPGVQALLYASFNIALVIASIPTFLGHYRPGVRVALVALGTAASYGFFFGVMLLSERV